MGTQRRAGAGAAVLAALAGCSVGTNPAPSRSTAPAPSASVNAVPIATPRTAAPALKTTGTAWPAILASLARYGQWILANPDPSQVAKIATAGCSMYGLISQQTTALFEEQAYLKPSPLVFSLVVGPSLVPGNEATLSVTASRPAETVVSRLKGTPIASFDVLPQTDLRITLFRGSDNKWRFCTVNAVSDTGDAEDPSIPLL
jgi:hypothetical protein